MQYLVEDQDKRQPRAVENAASVEHVGHEGDGVDTARRVDHIEYHGGKAGPQRLGDDGPRGRPGEHFDLHRLG